MYIELPKPEIRISIPDLVIDDTIIKREAYCSKMQYDIDAKNVIVFWIVQHFSVLEDGTKGEYLGQYIPDYVRPNTNVVCNIKTHLYSNFLLLV